jgi:hypothetical protein
MDDSPKNAETPITVDNTEAPEPDVVNFFRDNSIPIAGVLLASLVICLFLHYAANGADRDKVKDLAEIANHLIQSIAIILGGAWALFVFSRGRQLKESLVPTISGRVVVLDGQTFIIVNSQIHNVGQSKIMFLTGASTLVLYEYIKTPVTQVISMPDKMLGQFNPLDENDVYIEPNEIIYNTRFIAIPNPPDLGFRLELKIISARKNYTWRTAYMVEKSVPNVNIT